MTAEDREQVTAIYKDIQVQTKRFDNVMAGEPPVSGGRYEVVVTIHGGDTKLIQGLRVYWAYQSLFRKPPKEPLSSQLFDTVGSGSSVNLTIADYVIWPGRPCHPFPPVTDQKPISIGPIGDSPRLRTQVQAAGDYEKRKLFVQKGHANGITSSPSVQTVTLSRQGVTTSCQELFDFVTERHQTQLRSARVWR